MIAKPDKDAKVVTNYRPISLLNTMGKLFERVISHRLNEHFRDTNFFNEWQRAYQKKKEAPEIIYRLGEEITLAKTRGWFTTGVSLDVEKAFDAVWHDGLRYKLSTIGLPVKLLRLLSSFLTDRTVSVKVGSSLSQPVKLEAGTPQGSVLSPLLFLIYVNDIPLARPASNVRAGQFADDVNMWTSARTLPMAFTRLQRTLGEIEKWCSVWRIKINVAKTQLVQFRRVVKPKRVRGNLVRGNPTVRGKRTLKLFNQVIEEQRTMKVLGVHFDPGGRYVAHCKEKAVKAMRRVNLMRLVSGRKWGASTRTLLRLYKQYIRPVLEYGCVITAKACPSALQAMSIVERKALRVALRAPLYTRIKDLYMRSGVQPLVERMGELRCKAITRFGNSKAIQELESFRLQVTPS